MLPILTSLPGERRGYADGRWGQVHYREQGEGKPLLLCHQAPWASIQYHRVAPLLAARGFRVISPDLPGHGMSSPPVGPPNVEDYADNMVALLDALGIETCAVAGHHGGAGVAGRIAAAYPERVLRLALDNAPARSIEERAQTTSRPMPPVEVKPDGSHFTDFWATVRKYADPAWSDATVHIAVTTYFHNGPWRDQAFKASFDYDFLGDVVKITAPTLIVASREDPIYAYGKVLHQLRPDWSYDEFAGGTGVVFETPELWVDKIGGFLSL